MIQHMEMQQERQHMIVSGAKKRGAHDSAQHQQQDYQGLPKKPLIPLPHTVYGALNTCCAKIKNAQLSGNIQGIIQHSEMPVYVQLLRLFVQSADFHEYSLTALSGSKSLAREVQQIRLPTAQGSFGTFSKVTVGDSPSLLQRIDTSALSIVHHCVPMAVCKALGVPSILSYVTEVPRNVVPSAVKAQFADSDSTWTAFLHTTSFRYAIQRIVQTEQQQLRLFGGTSSSGGDHADTSNAAASIVKVTQQTFSRLSCVAVKTVASVYCEMYDRRDPSRNIAKSTACPLSVFSGKNIYLCTDGMKNFFTSASGIATAASSPSKSTGSPTTTFVTPELLQAVGVSRQHLLAAELNKILGYPITNLAPLVSVLTLAAGGPLMLQYLGPHMDMLGCVDLTATKQSIAISHTAMTGDVLKDEELVRFAVAKDQPALRPSYAKAAASGVSTAADGVSCYDIEDTHGECKLDLNDGLIKWVEKPTAKEQAEAKKMSAHSVHRKGEDDVIVYMPACLSPPMLKRR